MKKHNLFSILEKIAEHYSRNAAIRIYSGIIITIVGLFSAFSFSLSNDGTTTIRLEMGSISWVCVAAIIVVTIGFISIMLIQKCRNQYLAKQPEISVEYIGSKVLEPVFDKKCPVISKPAITGNQSQKSPLSYTLVDAISAITKQTAQIAKIEIVTGKRNDSFVPVKFKIGNNGVGTLRNYTLIINFPEGVIEIAYRNEERSLSSLTCFEHHKGYIDTETLEYSMSKKDPLVGGLCVTTDEFYVKPDPQAQSIRATWEIFADEYSCEGEIVIPVSPYYIDNSSIKTYFADHIVSLTK